MNKQASSCFLLALVMMLTLQVVTTTPTYQAPPPVNVSDLFTFYKSQVGSRVIGSKRVQALEIAHTTNASGPITEFKITYLNRSAPLSTSEATFGAQGQWQYVMGTQDSLSCNIVYEPTLQSYSLLRFDVDAPPMDQIIMIPPIPWTAIRDYMLALGQTITKEMIPAILQVGNRCQVGYVGTVVFRIIDEFQSVKIIILPNDAAMQAKTESFNYGIVNNKLYRYKQDTLQYQSIYNFPKFQEFIMRQMQGRLIIVGSNATDNTSLGMSYKVKQIFYVFEDKQIGFTKNLTLIKSLEYNGFSFQRSFNVETSPQLSKFGFGYTPLTANTSDEVVVVAKSVDYLNSKVVDLEFVDVDAYMQIASESDGLFDFNDNFLVVRSASLEKQVAYQFVGNKIIGFAERSLNGSVDKCVNILVDPYYKSTLIALVVHQVPEGYLIKQVQYGNYAATRRIVQPPPQSFIKFQIPPGDRINEAPEWTWFNSDGTDSVLEVFRLNQNGTNHFERITTTINFGQAIKASSPNCALVYEAGASKFAILSKDPTTGIFTRIDITSSLVGVLDSSQFLISERCDRLAVDNDIYYRSSVAGEFTKASQSFYSPSIDPNITYIADGYAILRFNHSTKEFETSFKEPQGIEFRPNTVIDSFNNRVVVYSLSKKEGDCPCTDGVSLNYSAFIDKGNRLSLVGNGSLMWDDIPQIKLSNGLTKALATGWINQAYEVKAIHFDYSALKNVSIIVPLEEVVRLQRFMQFQVYDSFIYIRQLQDPSKSADTTYTSVSNKQFVYFLSQDYLPRQIFQRKIPKTSETAWKKTYIISKNNNSALFTESMINEASKNHVVVDKSEIDPKQASITEGSTGGTGAFLKDGKVILCSPGCTDCTSGVCSQCNTGYVFEPNAAICLPCARGCSICDAADPKKCSDCYNGYLLQGNTCTRCDPKCISCAGTATSCLQCQHGEYFSVGDTCEKCPAHCDSCTASGCDVCRKGFTKDSNGKCKGCSIYCSSCDHTDITACTSCAVGLQLVSSKCVPCPDKCQVCNGNSCQQCAPGYNPNTAGKCVLNCLMPCATCVDNQPSVCTSCFGSSILSGGKCNIDKDCNQSSNCTDCGVGLNFFLFESKCYPCSSIANIDGCIQCSQANQQLCSLCKGGYFLDIEGSCSKCPESCMTCFDQGLCTSCQLGYTLPQSKTQGPCLQCISPCLTCVGVPNYCTSCISGYTKRGWKCQNDNYVGFTLKFPSNGVSDIRGIVDAIVSAVLTAAKVADNDQNKDKVTIQSIQTGSAVVSGIYSPGSGTVSSAATTISAGLSASSTIGTYTVTPIAFSVYSSTEDQKQSEDKKGLIIGVVIGSIVFIVLAVLAFVCFYRYRKNQLGMRVLEANGSMIQQEATPSEPINPQVQVAHVNKNFQIVDMDGPNKGSHAQFTLEKEIELN